MSAFPSNYDIIVITLITADQAPQPSALLVQRQFDHPGHLPLFRRAPDSYDEPHPA